MIMEHRNFLKKVLDISQKTNSRATVKEIFSLDEIDIFQPEKCEMYQYLLSQSPDKIILLAAVIDLGTGMNYTAETEREYIERSIKNSCCPENFTKEPPLKSTDPDALLARWITYIRDANLESICSNNNFVNALKQSLQILGIE